MVRRTGLAASAVALGVTAAVMFFGAANAAADSTRSPRSATPGNSPPGNQYCNFDQGSSKYGNFDQGSSQYGIVDRDSSQYGIVGHSSKYGIFDQGSAQYGIVDQGSSQYGIVDQGSSKPSISHHADDRADEDNAQAPLFPAPPSAESTSYASPPGELSTLSIGASIGGPTLGGWPATTGAGGTEAASASPVPTPPNGAEPSAAGSPAAAVLLVQAPLALTPVASAPVEESAAAPGVPAEGSAAIVVPDVGDDALDATGPLPMATGLSPDAHQSGVFVAVLALAVLLFLAGHQFVGRDRGLAGARDAESVARFQ